MFTKKVKKDRWKLLIVFISLMLISCSFIHKNENPPKRYGAIDAQINGCIKEYTAINATLSLEKYFNAGFDTGYTENDIDTTFDLLEISSDSTGRCFYDSLIPGYYKAIARGWSYNIYQGPDSSIKAIASLDKACGPVRIVNIRIGADSISFLKVNLPAGEPGWNLYRHYYKETIRWKEKIEANP